jgi:hypothetical protein
MKTRITGSMIRMFGGKALDVGCIDMTFIPERQSNE